ncbi:hypothetical protein C8R46DRAFT_1341513 [Mycena filopes]|nr:hypothetical protein C8R46DRAFT_1341513 [Mycena filopes]
MEYYQLGGFNPAILSSRSPPLANRVYDALRSFQDANEPSITLILGIRQSGTSHILLTQRERDYLLGQRNLDLWRGKSPPTMARDFESLSPIVFRDVKALSDKLGELQPKNDRDKFDSSRLNKGYTGGTQDLVRAQFENSRVFYKLLRNEVNPDAEKDLRFCCEKRPWTGSIRVFTFCYNLWLHDGRSLADRRRLPKILDLGWCEAENGLGENKNPLDGEMKSSQHIVFSNNQNLTNPGILRRGDDPKVPLVSERTGYEYDDFGATLVCDPQVAAEKVRAFVEEATQPTLGPLVLLVHDKDNAIAVLTSLGVDVSRWDYELKNLIRVPQPAPRRDESRRESMDPRRDSRDPRRPSADPRRGRSASPGPYDRSRRPRSHSPPRQRQYAPVYVVDVQSLVRTMLSTHDGSATVPEMIERLQLRLNNPPKGFCAGNECWMLVEAFRAMAAGRAVDEQKADWPYPTAVVRPVGGQASSYYPGADDESDYAGSESE